MYSWKWAFTKNDLSMRGTQVACPLCDEKGTSQVRLKGMMMKGATCLSRKNLALIFEIFFLVFFPSPFVFYFFRLTMQKLMPTVNHFFCLKAFIAGCLGKKNVSIAGSSIRDPSNQGGISWMVD